MSGTSATARTWPPPGSPATWRAADRPVARGSTPGPATGGCPPAASRSTCPARSTSPGSPPQWGGGVAFYDHAEPGFTAARGYLVTAAPVRRHRRPGDVPRRRTTATRSRTVVAEPLAGGRHQAGPGRYETLVEVGRHDDLPLLTFTAPHGARPRRAHAAHRGLPGPGPPRAARAPGVGRGAGGGVPRLDRELSGRAVVAHRRAH